MDWMYKGLAGNVDREEYLTGRRIDKTFEIMQKEENPNLHQDEDECAPINQLATAKYLSTSKNDEVAKLKEDPLFEIQSKQQEKLKELLHNPLKLKHLQQKLLQSLETDKAARKKRKYKKRDKAKKSKSKKKHRSKRKHHSSSSSDSSEESSASSSESGSEEEHRRHQHRHSRDKEQHHHTRDKDHHTRDRDHHHTRDKDDHHQRRQHSRSNERRPSKELRTEPHSSSSASSSSKASKSRAERRPAAPEAVPPKRPRLNEEEMQRRRAEMMNNAAQCDEDRAQKVQRLNERERLMDERDEQSKSGGGGHFIKPILNKIASSASIEDSIRKKRFTSQRPGTSMEESNFARRK